MNRHHTGSGRRRAVPVDWAANHAPVAAGTRNAEVSLYTGDAAGSWSEEGGRTSFSAAAPYATAVSARIQSLTAGATDVAELAGETLPTPAYLVAVDFGQDAEVGTTVKVTACPGDLPLVGRQLRVEHVVQGSERFERDLICVLQVDRAEATP